MTTGRINQVTNLPRASPRTRPEPPSRGGRAPPSKVGVSSTRFHQSGARPSRGTHPDRRPNGPTEKSQRSHYLVPPISHVSGRRPPVPEATKMASYGEDYQRPADVRDATRSRRILEWLIASGLAIGNQSTPFWQREPRKVRLADWHQVTGTRRPAPPHPKPVHPGHQAHPWLGTGKACRYQRHTGLRGSPPIAFSLGGSIW
jgi:hypothetical protein